MAKLSLCCKDEVSLSMLFNVGLFEVLWDEVVVHLEEQVLRIYKVITCRFWGILWHIFYGTIANSSCTEASGPSIASPGCTYCMSVEPLCDFSFENMRLFAVRLNSCDGQWKTDDLLWTTPP